MKGHKDVIINILMTPLRKKHEILEIASSSLTDLPAPINISIWWNYGSLLSLFLMLQVITGILLSIHYSSHTELAFKSLIHIRRDVNWGWALHNIHINGASIFILFIYIHMARGIFYGSFNIAKTWNTGIMIFILAIVTAFIGYVLPWGQIRYWGATVITNIFSAIPYLGDELVKWLWGRFTVANPTLNRFFIIHFILPFSMLLLITLHFIFLHSSGSSNPLGINSNSDRISFHQYFRTKDIIGFILYITIFLLISILTPNYLNDPENFIEADPLITPTHIQPEWYFLWLYAILRSIPNKLGGVVALLLAIFIIFTLPVIHPQYKLPSSYYPFSKLLFFFIIRAILILRWIGTCPVDSPFIIIGQLSRLLYFIYFLFAPYLLNIWNRLLI